MTGKHYSRVLRSPGIGVWFAVLVCQRFPVAMAPLALVFLGHEATGSPPAPAGCWRSVPRRRSVRR
ncbi:hypothetical protein OIE66_27000 [Nonomuraea sp. NBC_01738]|uniref:hypothetical protein n=1 Tax=Nonomuraea sp. NBC_01738 TaxID=2976003 RepID=UPI002E0E3B7D|nr:hypothetical protein OIE66_27000 [Nonomuraea sp. NBC_01738]